MHRSIEEVAAFILSVNDKSLSEEEGHVYQVWEDGEITLQKCGSLLGQRNLHCITPGFDYHLPLSCMPYNNSKHGWAYVNEDNAKIVRCMIGEWIKDKHDDLTRL